MSCYARTYYYIIFIFSCEVVSDQQRRSVVGASVSAVSSMPENYSPPDPPGPFSPVGSFQCLPALGSHLKEQELQRMLQRQLPYDLDASFKGSTQPNSSVNEIFRF